MPNARSLWPVAVFCALLFPISRAIPQQKTDSKIAKPFAEMPRSTYYHVGKDKEVPLYCSDGTTCKIVITVARPGRGVFRIKPFRPGSPELNGTLTLQRSSGSITRSHGDSKLRTDSLNAGASPPYELQSGDYVITVLLSPPPQQNKEQAAGHQPTGTVTLEQWAASPLPRLTPRTKTFMALVLDRISARAHYEIALESRSRLLFRVSLPSGYHKGESYFFTAWATSPEGQRYDPEVRAEVADGQLFYFVLPRGQLILTIQFRDWIYPLPEDFPRSPLNLELAHISTAPLPPSLLPLQSWLQSLQLDKKIEIQDMACKVGPSEGTPREVQYSFPELFGDSGEAER